MNNVIKKYTPTEAAKNNNSRALALIEKYNKDIKASKLEDLDLDSIKKLYAELQVLEKQANFKQRTHDGCLNTKTLEFLSKGGNAALAWSRLILKEQGILKSYQKEIKAEETNTEDKLAVEHLKIFKATDDEKRIATFLVLEPQDEDGSTSDLHLDWYDAEVIEKACRNFNKYCMKANLLHLVSTNGFEFVESYITPTDFSLEGKFIKKGSWLATIHVVEQPEYDWIWEGIKAGEFTGLSIQAMGSVETIE